MQDIPYDVSHVPIDYDEPFNVNEVSAKISNKDASRKRREKRVSLEKDIAKLQKKLMIEVNMRNALNRGLSRPLGSLPRIYGCLPVETRELLLEVAVLEEEIMSLEKQVICLGRQIVSEVPPMDKEHIWRTLQQISCPEEADVVVSPTVASKNSARTHSKPTLSPDKTFVQQSNSSKPLTSAGKVVENKCSFRKVSISSGNSLDNGSFIKPPMYPMNSFEPRRTSLTIPPTKSQVQRNNPFQKVLPGNSRDLKSRKILSVGKEQHDVYSSVGPTVPFIPTQPSDLKEKITSPVLPAPGSPHHVGKNSTKCRRMRTEDGKAPMKSQNPFKRKDPIDNKVPPAGCNLKPTNTPASRGQNKGPVDLAMRTPRLPRQPLMYGTQRELKASTAKRVQRTEHTRTTLAAPNMCTSLNHDSSPQTHCQNPDVFGTAKKDSNHVGVPSTVTLDGDCRQTGVSPAQARIHGFCLNDRMEQESRSTCSPETRSQLSSEQVADSILLSVEVVKLLEKIYANMNKKQSSLTSEPNSSSQASMSTSLSSTSPDDYEMTSGTNMKFRLDDFHAESFRTETGSTTKSIRLYYSGEIENSLDLSRGNISNRVTGFRERLM
uniref:Ternary complex factor MIP1 leucine-zipper domain-containing protein n=2 Tax=Physcomitrium patens TaxID=3218 RepID=A0A2K1KZU6_PHYPA|nr:hypothetical protein PHYPA_002090 [Physcomitrium patens]